MTKNIPISELQKILNTLQQGLNQLLSLLQQEQSALLNIACNDIEKYAHEKEKISNHIEKTEQERQSLCKALQITPDKAGIEQLISKLPLSLAKTLSLSWEQITQLGSACAEQNQLNGILLSHQHHHTQEALAVLRGALDNNDIYSNKGAHETPGYLTSLGRV